MGPSIHDPRDYDLVNTLKKLRIKKQGRPSRHNVSEDRGKYL